MPFLCITLTLLHSNVYTHHNVSLFVCMIIACTFHIALPGCMCACLCTDDRTHSHFVWVIRNTLQLEWIAYGSVHVCVYTCGCCHDAHLVFNQSISFILILPIPLTSIFPFLHVFFMCFTHFIVLFVLFIGFFSIGFVLFERCVSHNARDNGLPAVDLYNND